MLGFRPYYLFDWWVGVTTDRCSTCCLGILVNGSEGWYPIIDTTTIQQLWFFWCYGWPYTFRICWCLDSSWDMEVMWIWLVMGCAAGRLLVVKFCRFLIQKTLRFIIPHGDLQSLYSMVFVDRWFIYRHVVLLLEVRVLTLLFVRVGC